MAFWSRVHLVHPGLHPRCLSPTIVGTHGRMPHARYFRMLTKAIAALGIISINVATAAAQNYVVPDHDARIVISLQPINVIFQHLQGMQYRGILVRGTHFCSSPHIQIDLASLSPDLNGFLDFRNARSGYGGKLNAVVPVTISHCIPGHSYD